MPNTGPSTQSGEEVGQGLPLSQRGCDAWPPRGPRLLVSAPSLLPSQMGHLRTDPGNQQDTAEMTGLPPYSQGIIVLGHASSPVETSRSGGAETSG